MLFRPLFLIFILSHFCLLAAAQEVFVVSGQIIDSEDQAPLYSAAVQVVDTPHGGFSDVDGNFSLKLESGIYNIQISFLGYHVFQKEIKVPEETHLRVELIASDLVTQEIVISNNSPTSSLQSIEVGKHVLKGKEIQELTYLLGEVDPLKAIQFLPGVQASGEGSAGFYVRGGAADQNLILFDEAPIYNASHLFGFFSVFNGAAIEKVELLKGGMSAKFGGRLSSFLNIQSKTPDKNNLGAEASLGVIAGSFYVEAPVVKEKLAVSVAGRRTYLDLLNKSLLKDVNYSGKDLNYFFYDLNSKIDYQDGKDKISLSFYSGVDDFQYLGKVSNHIVWKNMILSANWHHKVNDQFATHLTGYLSHYDLNFGASLHTYKLDLFSAIKDRGIKGSAVYFLNEHHEIEFGGELIHHSFLPNKINAFTDEQNLNFGHVQKINALEYSSFLNSSYTLNDRLLISLGLRHSAYWQKGPFDRFETDAGFHISDTIAYSKGEIVTFYQNWEPRVAFRFSLNSESSLKASYDYHTQYVHMVPMSSVSLPSDMWVPSSENIKPQKGQQFSIGYFRNFSQNVFETSVSAYYKLMDNQIEYRNGVIVGYSKGVNFDDNYYYGEGKSKGIEMMVKKNAGKFTGAVSYTLSKTDKDFKDIDEGRVFPAKYDRRHDLSINATYKLNKKWQLMGVFIYATGNALTLPEGRYIINGNIVNEYGDRNQFRMPAYHRMDLSAEYALSKNKRTESSLILSCFNTYNRKNPYYIYFDVSGNLNEYHLEIEPVQVSIFTLIPSITYRIKLL